MRGEERAFPIASAISCSLIGSITLAVALLVPAATTEDRMHLIPGSSHKNWPPRALLVAISVSPTPEASSTCKSGARPVKLSSLLTPPR